MFSHSYGEKLFAEVNAIHNFKAGRPSDFGLCEPSEDLPIMMVFVSRKQQIQQVRAKISQRKQRYNAFRKRPVRGR